MTNHINSKSAGSKSEIKSQVSGQTYVIEHTILPDNPEDIPNIIGWSGPSRVGSTALLYLLSGHPAIDRAYFQPQATLMRLGAPDFELSAKDKVICMKEVFWSLEHTKTPHDPIDLLMRAGVPANKIIWIFMLRDPVQIQASWEYFDPGIDPTLLAFWQSHTIKLYEKYKALGINAIPFCYEMLEGRESQVLSILLDKIGLEPAFMGCEFDLEAIKSKLVPGQAADDEYFKHLLKPTVERKRFSYGRNRHPLDSKMASRVVDLCMSDYAKFFKAASEELGIR